MQIAQAGVRIPQELFVKPSSGAEPPRTYFDYIARTTPRRKPEVPTPPEGVALALRGRIWDWPQNDPDYQFEAILKHPLSAHVFAEVYERDPISNKGPSAHRGLRPNRSWLDLDPQRQTRQFPELVPVGGKVTLAMNDATGALFVVTRSPLVDRVALNDRDKPEELDVTMKNGQTAIDEHVRSNEFAAINAYLRARDFFERLVNYGLPPRQYFRSAALPLLVRYRAGITPGATDGRTINAQVVFMPRPELSNIQPSVNEPAGLEVRFALGDLDCSADSQLRPSTMPRTPLGIASDPRWSWHEFCHVMLAAATGELEFPFAHSAGDAIAAILCDPSSQLASHADWRHATFPWVEEPRRHDRDPRRGWSWRGSLFRHEKFFAEPLSDRRGYWAEQILSTTLFRLYRAIGGDTEAVVGGKYVPDVTARTAAANYAVYLVFQALRISGPASVVSLESPEHLLFAMQVADLGTSAVPAGWVTYPGGSARKVVQWAFERQGLYGEGLESPNDTDRDGDISKTFVTGRRTERTPRSTFYRTPRATSFGTPVPARSGCKATAFTSRSKTNR